MSRKEVLQRKDCDGKYRMHGGGGDLQTSENTLYCSHDSAAQSQCKEWSRKVVY